MNADVMIPLQLRVHIGIARLRLNQPLVASSSHFPFLYASDTSQEDNVALFYRVAEAYIKMRSYKDAIIVLEYLENLNVCQWLFNC
jgi:hypothetical protein